jgi:hypothetical protein
MLIAKAGTHDDRNDAHASPFTRRVEIDRRGLGSAVVAPGRVRTAVGCIVRRMAE